MFYEMDGSFHRDAFGSQAGRMEHPRGSGAESTNVIRQGGRAASARGGPGMAACLACTAGSSEHSAS